MIVKSPPKPEQKRRKSPALNAYREEAFPALRLARSSRIVRRLGRVILMLLIGAVLAMLLAPWQQSIRGEGAVIAFDPFERPQPVQAPIGGRIESRGEGVFENAYVEKGQLLVQIVDQDPQKLFRLQRQVSNAEQELVAARSRLERAEDLKRNSERIVDIERERLAEEKLAQLQIVSAAESFVAMADAKLLQERQKQRVSEAKLTQVKLDFDRKTALEADGLVSGLDQQILRREYEAALGDLEVAKQAVIAAERGAEGKVSEREAKRSEWQAKIKKTESEIEKALADIDKASLLIAKTTEEINAKDSKLQQELSKLSVQQTQEVRAPRDGYIVDLAIFDESSIIKAGDQLCRIVPQTDDLAVQVWVSGNDAPLISKGRPVRLQFEGWPAVQFSGWPSVAVGTFGGIVALVDATATEDGAGKFRVVVTPDPNDQEWPGHPHLRQGVRSNGWVLLDQVPLGYEVWRRMNGFPQALQSQEEASKSSAKPPKIKI